ncbi:MAG: hypothetical protein QXG86_01455 [Candidatus Woesearchaeota archaeon]
MRIITYIIIVAFLLAGCATEEQELQKVVKSSSNQSIRIINISNTQNISEQNQQQSSDNTTTQNETIISNITNTTQHNISVSTHNITTNMSNLSTEINVSNYSNYLKNLTIEFINQFETKIIEGNSILITTPKNKKILIDGGTNKDGLYIVQYLISRRIYKVDYIFASNALDYNVGGLDSVILNYNETSAFYSGLRYSSYNAYINYLNYADKIAHSINSIRENKEINIDDTIKFYVFVPFENNSLGSPKDDTLVFKIEYGDASYLFLGDCTDLCFENIKNNDLSADIVKVNNHISPEIIEKVSPKVIIFNKIPENFTTKAKVYSKENGTIRVVSDSQKYYISTTKQ